MRVLNPFFKRSRVRQAFTEQHVPFPPIVVCIVSIKQLCFVGQPVRVQRWNLSKQWQQKKTKNIWKSIWECGNYHDWQFDPTPLLSSYERPWSCWNSLFHVHFRPHYFYFSLVLRNWKTIRSRPFFFFFFHLSCVFTVEGENFPSATRSLTRLEQTK